VHVTPSELRILQQDRIQIRFALLATMAYVIAELPDTGSRETPLEVPCTRPHWGFVLDGDVVFASDGMQQVIPPGSAFHIPPAHPPHTFKVEGRARIAGFEPIDPAVDTSDEALVSRGFQLTGSERTTPASVIPAAIATLLEAPLIEARQWPMSSFMLTQARFGPGSGYLEDWCDAPHWGVVTTGRLAIEWEDDIEIVSAGDIYHCPAGPPGHRLEAADPASIIDLTPIAALASGIRLADWRQVDGVPETVPESGRTRIEVAGLG
jgi:quercetin dioxygenase-like cupin family protein